MMTLSYFTTSIRSLIRQKHYLLINLMGLAVGIAAYLLIMLYVTYERSFDDHILQKENIFRVVEIQDEPGVGNQHVAITMGPLGQALKEYFPEVKESTRILPAYSIRSVRNGEKIIREMNMFYTDPSVINMFSINFLRGNPSSALKRPNTLVLSKTSAEKYFGTIDKAMNGLLLLDDVPYRVDAIMEDSPRNTHIIMDILISMSSIELLPEYEWMKHYGSNSLVTYILLDNKASADKINNKLPEFVKKVVLGADDGWDNLEMYIQPLEDVYLKSQHIKFQMMSSQGDNTTVIILTVIAILILLIACVNYINISLARSLKQAREVGMRKVLGADRMSLIYRYISESFIITLCSVLLSIGILELILPEINKTLDTNLLLNFRKPLFNIGLVSLVIAISLISGSYPAFYLSKFQPISVLKGRMSNQGKTGYLSKVLMVFQFAISIGLIFSILMINKQVKYIQEKDLGINYTNSVFLTFGQDDYKKLDVLKHTLLENPSIKEVSGTSYINGVSGSQGPIFVDDTARTKLTVRYGFVDENFFKAMNINIVEGRNFDKNIKSDSIGVILNQSAIDKLGWKDPIGKKFIVTVTPDSIVKPVVIGVIQDYHYYSLKNVIEPAAYFFAPDRFQGVTIKYTANTSKKALESYLEKVWKEIYPKTPFTKTYSEQYLHRNYSDDLKVRTLFIYFSIISMFLSCLGLYGLTSLLIEQKTKNIGIRKVLGSPVYSIIFNLVREYLMLVVLAGIIAIPVSIIFIQRFLDNFPYRVQISVLNILIAVTASIIVAFVTIYFKASKTANSNPLESLKYE